MVKKLSVFILLLSALLLSACGGSSDSSSDGSSANNDDKTVKSTRFVLEADYTSPWVKNFVKEAQVEGQDQDGDGGVWTEITPTNFKVAIKRVKLIQNDGTVLDLIPDAGTLANSQVYDLSTDSITVSADEIPNGTYQYIEFEIYYFQITMNMNIPAAEQTIRVYMSDDNFPAEGELGHHQGDITLINADVTTEAGWARGGEPWTVNHVDTTRTAAQNGAAGTDTETGHDRGFFGDSTFWNNGYSGVFDPEQGANQDIFTVNSPIGLTVEDDTDITISLIFHLTDTWGFEDFDPEGTDGHGIFNPGAGGVTDANDLDGDNDIEDKLQDGSWYNDGTDASAEWAPIFRIPIIDLSDN